MLRFLTICSVVLAAACAGQHAPPTTSPSVDGTALVNRDANGVAIGGYDPVAYFTDGKPTPGDPTIRAVHQGALYYFTSQDHRWQFLRDPDRFAPAFGGYCGYAVSIQRLSPTDPTVWQIAGGQLVLQNNKTAFELFNRDLTGNLARATANWPELRRRHGLPAHYVVNVDIEGVAIAGYDPITYFEGAPAQGVPAHLARYGGATYWFTSESHRAKFETDPSHYAPAFGGFCGYAASLGRFAPVDPHIYLVQHDLLVLQHTQEALGLYQADPEGALQRAKQNWPGLVARAGL